jgi:hypothetical protein
MDNSLVILHLEYNFLKIHRYLIVVCSLWGGQSVNFMQYSTKMTYVLLILCIQFKCCKNLWIFICYKVNFYNFTRFKYLWIAFKLYTEYEQNICYFGWILHEIDTLSASKGTNYYKHVKKTYNFRIKSCRCHESVWLLWLSLEKEEMVDVILLCDKPTTLLINCCYQILM